MAEASRVNMHETHNTQLHDHTRKHQSPGKSRSSLQLESKATELELPEFVYLQLLNVLERAPSHPLAVVLGMLTQPRLASAMALLATAATAFSEAFGM